MSKFIGNGLGWQFVAGPSVDLKNFAERMSAIKAGFDPNQPRNPDGTWGGGGSARRSTPGGASGSGDNPTKINIKEQFDSHVEGGGSTFMQDGSNAVGAKGMAAVSRFPEHSLILEGELTEARLLKYIQDKKDFLSLSPDYAVGSWYDASSNRIYLDISEIKPLNEAIEIGIKYNQKAIFDLENMLEIDTGGSGEVKGKVTPNKSMNTKENWAKYGAYLAKLRSNE